MQRPLKLRHFRHRSGRRSLPMLPKTPSPCLCKKHTHGRLRPVSCRLPEKQDLRHPKLTARRRSCPAVHKTTWKFLGMCLHARHGPATTVTIPASPAGLSVGSRDGSPHGSDEPCSPLKNDPCDSSEKKEQSFSTFLRFCKHKFGKNSFSFLAIKKNSFR